MSEIIPEKRNEMPQIESDTFYGMTSEQRAEARAYARTELKCVLMDRVLDLSYLGVVMFFVAYPLDIWLKTFMDGNMIRDAVRAVVLFLVVILGHVCVSLPLSFYSGYVVEKRYGLSTLSMSRWFQRYVKNMLLTLIIGLIMYLALFYIIRICNSWWWLVASGVFFIFSYIMGQLFPVLILPLFYKIQPLNHPELEVKFRKCLEGSTLQLSGVYRIEMSAETQKANACLAGLGSTRRVLLGDTLLEGYTPEEITAILAHEVGHYVHHHLLKLLIVMLVGSVGFFFLCDQFLQWWIPFFEGWVKSSQSDPFSYAQFPVWALPTLMFVSTFFSFMAEPILNGISRNFERHSDAYAVSCGYGSALADAFIKLGIQNKADPDPYWLEVLLFESHPSLGERIRNVRR